MFVCIKQICKHSLYQYLLKVAQMSGSVFDKTEKLFKRVKTWDKVDKD